MIGVHARDFFSASLTGNLVAQRVVNMLVAQNLPDLHAAFEAMDVATEFLSTQWFTHTLVHPSRLTPNLDPPIRTFDKPLTYDLSMTYLIYLS